MKTLPSCILYSRDEKLGSRLARIAEGVVALQPIESQAGLEEWLPRFGDTLLLADLRAPNCLDALFDIKAQWPASVIIVMGVDRSDPMLAAEWLEPFAAIGLEPDRRAFLTLLRNAVENLKLRQKTRLLEGELARLRARQGEAKPPQRTLFSAPLQNFSKAQKNFDNLDLLFDSVVEGLVATARVSRAGIFIQPAGETSYVFQAGRRCLASTESFSIPGNSPFVRWLEMNTHLVSRRTLENIPDPEDRAMLRQMLDSLGAEIIIPLYATGRVQGWILIGQRATGIPFDIADLEDLTGLADHISTTLENALQYEETALQKALAETLLHSIPFGIVACDESATIRWFNSSAREILQTGEESAVGRPVEALGSRMADILRRALAEPGPCDAREWTDPRTKLTLSAETRRLMDGDSCVGAMAMLRDVTGAKLLKEKEEQLERAAFWNELASSMSHEIRNPLVAIKTFAQLLPERYDDADFRAQFSKQVSAEVDQLNRIVDKINGFANLPPPVFQALDIRKPVEHAISRIRSRFNHENLAIHFSSDDSPLPVNGDAASLEECFYQLLKNSAENLDNKPGSRIAVMVRSRHPKMGSGKVFATVSDNGSGIDESVRDKVFSPFSTIKARGLGLGLPIAKRVVIDHGGQMDIETGAGGTHVTITFPALDKTCQSMPSG